MTCTQTVHNKSSIASQFCVTSNSTRVAGNHFMRLKNSRACEGFFCQVCIFMGRPPHHPSQTPLFRVSALGILSKVPSELTHLASRFLMALPCVSVRSLPRNTMVVSAGDVDGVDHWSSLTTKDDKEQGTASEGPRSEMLYNWDPYLLWSQDEL